MKILIADQRKRILLLCLAVAVFLVFVVLSAVRYRSVNARVKERIESRKVSYGEVYALNGLEYLIEEPKRKTVYDKDYEMDVYRYTFQVTLKNKTRETVIISDVVSGLYLFSGGEVWSGDVTDGEMIAVDAGHEQSFEVAIDVVPEEGLDQVLYDTYDFYNIIQEGNVTYKMQYE